LSTTSIVGTTLVPFFWTHSSVPILIRAEPVVLGSVMATNFSATYFFLQFHRGNPGSLQVPLFSVPMPPNGGTTILDATHLGMTGVSSDNMWMAISLAQVAYSAATVTNGSTQLMIR
jgi:hypothetical protein